MAIMEKGEKVREGHRGDGEVTIHLGLCQQWEWGGEHLGQREQSLQGAEVRKGRACSESLEKGCRHGCMTVCRGRGGRQGGR